MYEQEVTTGFNVAEGIAEIYTADPVWIRKMDRLMQQNPKQFGPGKAAGRRPVSSYSGINNSSTVSCSSFARANAKDNVGSYLSFSIAFTVCRDTLHLFASSSCDSPRAFRLLLMIFFISVAIPFLII